MPSQCPYGQNYDVIHAVNCKKGGFIKMRHNVWDFEANLLKTTLNDVEMEPKLQNIDNEGLNSLTGDDGRPDKSPWSVEVRTKCFLIHLFDKC